MAVVVRTRARLVGGALACLLVASTVSLLTAGPARAANPDIVSPTGGVAVDTVPNLEWRRVQDATRYDVQVSTTDAFTTRLVDTTTLNSQYTPTIQLPVGDLWWRVRVTGSGDPGWSRASFRREPVAAPTMLGPSGPLQQPTSPPLISWTSVAGATSYNVQVSTDHTFTDPTKIFTYTPTRTTTAINPSLVVPNTYYARTQAVLANGLSTAFAEPTEYTIVGLKAAQRTSPAEGGVVTDTVLDWKPVAGAATYQLEIDEDPGFGSALTVNGIRGSRYSPPATIANDTYYWRVRPVDAAGNARNWQPSDRGTFKRAWPGQVTLEHPANDATVGDAFYYQWSPSERTSSSQEDRSLSSSYTLEVSQSPTFQGSVARCDTVLTTYVPQTNNPCWPRAAGTYYWRVIGHDDLGGNRPPTDQPSAAVHRFTYLPDAPRIVSPVNGDHVTVPTLRWSPRPGATRYRVTITPTAGGSRVQDTTTSTSYTPRTLLPPGSYSWQVQAISEDGRLGAELIFDPASFVVDTLPAATAPSPEPLGSPRGRRFPTLRWTPVAGATRYEVLAKPVASTGFMPLAGSFAYAAGEARDTSFLEPGDYDWFVKAYNSAGALVSAGSQGRFTIDPLERIPDDAQYAALAGGLLPGDPEQPDPDADACQTQIVTADGQSACDNLRGTPVLRWAEVPNAGSYQLFVSFDKEMTNPVYDRNNDGVFSPIVTVQPMWTPTAALPDSTAGTAYYYLVVPCSVSTACGPLVHARHSFDKLSRKVALEPVAHTPLTASTPTACPPESPTSDRPVCANDVTLSWQDYRNTQVDNAADDDTPLTAAGRTEAFSYTVQTSQDPNFSSVIETTEVDQTTFTSALTYPEGPVYWRVRARDGSRNLLPWSDTAEFVKRSPAPVLESPNATTVRGDLHLAWAAQEYAAQYRIEIYKNHDINANAANRAIAPAVVGSRMVSLTGPLAQLPRMADGSDPYVWRVRRIDAYNREGAWSDWGSFTVVEPTTTLASPVVGAPVAPSDALFTWTAVSGAESYRFERRLKNTSSVVEPITTRALSWAPQAAITSGEWEWRVTPVDASGQAMTATDWRPFTVEAAVLAEAAPVIGGSGRVGEPLTVTSPPVWNFGAAVRTGYQWFRGTSPISGATGETYVATSADKNLPLSVTATGRRDGYTEGTSKSNVIGGLSGQAPVATTAVALGGTGKVGTNLSLSPPVWDNDATTTTYQWLRDGANVGGVTTATTYAVTSADVGMQLTVKAIGTRAGFDPGSSTSEPILGVLGDAPVATSDVAISGPSTKPGATLTLTAPVWGTTGVVTSYQWFRDADPIALATAAAYRLVDADIGHSVTVRATGRKDGYQPGLSVSNGVVGTALEPVANTGAPAMSGVAAARETLTVSTGSWQATSALAYAYQWFVDGVAVAKATGSTYVVRTIDAGHTISARVTATASGFASGTATTATVPVAKLASTTTVTLAAKKITQRKRAVLTVKVAMAGYDVPLGQVQVKDGGKVAAQVGLQTAKDGTITIRLKKLKPGKHKLTVSYLGSAATQSSAAKAVILKVTRAKKPKK